MVFPVLTTYYSISRGFGLPYLNILLFLVVWVRGGDEDVLEWGLRVQRNYSGFRGSMAHHLFRILGSVRYSKNHHKECFQ